MRTLIALTLIAALTLTSMGRPALRQEEEETPAQTQPERLTPEEEREARALAEEFIARLEKTQDVTPLLKELYISDFVERLRQDDLGALFPLALTPEVAAAATPEEIRRVYTASINVLYLGMKLFIAAHLKRKQGRRDETAKAEREEADFTIEEIIPPTVIKLIQSDPVLAGLLAKALAEEAAKRAPQQDAAQTPETSESDAEQACDDPQSFEDLMPIKSIEQMRHYLSLMEQGLDLIRAYLKTLPPELTASIKDFWTMISKDEEEAEGQKNYLSLYPNRLDSEFMGYPKGTRFICVQSLLHMELVRTADGSLKIVKVHLPVD